MCRRPISHPMKAAIFLPVDYHAHNFMRVLAVEIHQKYQTGLHAASFPPHISLKLPFRLSNLADLETYVDQLAASTSPLEIGDIVKCCGLAPRWRRTPMGYW